MSAARLRARDTASWHWQDSVLAFGKFRKVRGVRLAVCGIAVLASCSRFDRANQAAADEIQKLSHETFAQAAGHDRCIADDCSRQEAGFAYAKKNHVREADDCLGKGDGDFVEGCRQYGENVNDAYTRQAPNP